MGLLVVAAVSVVLLVVGAAKARGPGPREAHRDVTIGTGKPAYRAFTDNSFWNTPVPGKAPTNPRAAQILAYLRSGPDNGGGFLRLAGAGHSPWGQPVYWADAGDPTYRVRGTDLPELRRMRIPVGALPAATSDAAMTVFDRGRGIVVAFTGAGYDRDTRVWHCTGATVTHLSSNGLDWRTGRSDDRRNRGTHRGNNGAVMMVRLDEVRAGRIGHLLKVSAGPPSHVGFLFPMVGSDGDVRLDAAPKQGLRLRIRPSVDLDKFGLEPAARVIARALQRYGMYIGDSGGTTSLKLENTRAEGRGQLWPISSHALSSLPFTSHFWQVLPEGYRPPP